MDFAVVISVGVTAALVPLVTSWMNRRFPPAPLPPGVDMAQLRRRNLWIDNIAVVLCLLGVALMIPVAFAVPAGLGEVAVPRMGLAFSMMAVLPLGWISLATLPSGRARLEEYWLFYQQRWKIGRGVIILAYMLFLAIGLVSAVALLWAPR